MVYGNERLSLANTIDIDSSICIDGEAKATACRYNAKPDETKGSPISMFFGTVRLFIENSFKSSKGPPSIFRVFSNKMDVEKS